MRDNTPVLIGAGQFTYRGPAERSPSGPRMIKTAAEGAAIGIDTVGRWREGPRTGADVGHDADGHRFVANTPDDETTLLGLEAVDSVGRPGSVRPVGDGLHNPFTPD